MFTLVLAAHALAFEPAITADPALVAFDEPVLFLDLGEAGGEVPRITWSDALPEVDDEIREQVSWGPEVYGGDAFAPAPWTEACFGGGRREGDPELAVSLPSSATLEGFDEPVLFLPLPAELALERAQPLLVVSGLAAFDEPVLFREKRLASAVPLVVLSMAEGGALADLALRGPLVRLVDVEGRVTDLTAADLGGAEGTWILEGRGDAGGWELAGYGGPEVR